MAASEGIEKSLLLLLATSICRMNSTNVLWDYQL
jgi:hypothetical protein